MVRANVFNGAPDGSRDTSSGRATITGANRSTINVTLAGSTCTVGNLMAF